MSTGHRHLQAWFVTGSQHLYGEGSVATEALVDFAEIAGTELVTIDASTSAAAFRRELRWNQAFSFLDRGP